jgi:hypothetical protein
MVKFLILSDIHACDVDPASSRAPSYVSSFNASATARIDPLTDLERLIQDNGLAPDYILCAGDITNRSSPSSFNYAWNRLHKLAEGSGSGLVATVGNHDLDSRYQDNKFDPRGYAMALRPSLPVKDRTSFLEFWAQNFTLLSYSDCNIVVLNTAAYHGAGEDAKAEIEHGRISDATLVSLGEVVASAPQCATNILLCHHHPIKADRGDFEVLRQTIGGDKLIDLLDQASSPWIIVHGHKHVPDLFYGHGGGANAPVVLGSASFSAQVNADAQNKNPNQVHLLATDPEGAKSSGLTYAGTVMSWTWQVGVGWRKAQGTQGLPYISGFGYKSSVTILAEQIETHLQTVLQSHISWGEAVRIVPSLLRLVPSDFRLFRQALSKLGLTILSDEDGDFAQIGRRT